MMIAERLYLKPVSVEQAVAVAAEHEGNFRFVAGGTDFIINKFQGNETANVWIDITGIEALKNVFVDGDFLKIGSLVKLDDLKKFPLIAQNFSALIESAHSVASPMIRKTATIGGNILCENRCVFYNQSEWWRDAAGNCLKCGGDICIATGGKKACFSKFVSDTAPVLISMDAQIEIMESNETKTIPLENIYTGNGIEPRTLSNNTLIKYIVIPLNRNFITVYKKLRVREAVDFTSLTTAVSVDDSGKIKIVLGGVDPKPIMVEGNINGDFEAYIKLALKKSRVIDNDVYSRSYRREMISVFLRQSFEQIKNAKHKS